MKQIIDFFFTRSIWTRVDKFDVLNPEKTGIVCTIYVLQNQFGKLKLYRVNS